jgi:hypothetical protein
MNHLEALTAEWLAYNGYFTRSTIKVGKRAKGGWDGELDVVGFHPARQHFIHVECSIDANSWPEREKKFRQKFEKGRKHAAFIFSGMELPSALDQVVVHGFAGAANKHRDLGGGRLMTSQELAAEIMNGIPTDMSKSAVPENFPIIRTLQLSIMAGTKAIAPDVRLIPENA